MSVVIGVKNTATPTNETSKKDAPKKEEPKKDAKKSGK